MPNRCKERHRNRFANKNYFLHGKHPEVLLRIFKTRELLELPHLLHPESLKRIKTNEVIHSAVYVKITSYAKLNIESFGSVFDIRTLEKQLMENVSLGRF